MKKILGILVSITFAFVLLFNVKLGEGKDSNRDVKLENVKALACYTAEDENGSSMECCEPWDQTCWMILPGYFVPGTWGSLF